MTELAKTAIANRRWSQSFSTMLARVVTDDLEYLAGLMAEGSLRPVVDRTYPLAHVAEAIRYVEGGHAAGKVTLEI